MMRSAPNIQWFVKDVRRRKSPGKRCGHQKHWSKSHWTWTLFFSNTHYWLLDQAVCTDGTSFLCNSLLVFLVCRPHQVLQQIQDSVQISCGWMWHVSKYSFLYRCIQTDQEPSSWNGSQCLCFCLFFLGMLQICTVTSFAQHLFKSTSENKFPN